MSSQTHVIFGTGPVGCWIARSLEARGEDVRAVNRSGNRPVLMPSSVEMVKADVSDHMQAIKAAGEATVVYQALNPAYHQWHDLFPGLQAGAIAAARATGARYVSIENLYMYDSAAVMNEESAIAPRSGKGELRGRMAAEVLAAHASGEIRATILRSSDYYGPGVLGSSLGDRVFPPILSGKKGEALGGLDIRHSYAYIEDVGRAAVALATHDEALGRVWISPHVSAPTQREVLDAIFAQVGREPQYSVVAPWTMKLFGLFNAGAKEVVEMMYEFTEPFVVDSGSIERTFALTPTPLEEGLARTIAWYRVQDVDAA